ncbi:hypothetical protein [Nocardia bovistercoris]|uniref:Sensor domain-containing protein n=1 Tax=Nocardia bovistercoris TaxID=2785916 RepID=A0A931IA77_9NOCA|nr:hypothetical protein [Nocardia bovistercoris]MBH0776896.1 hypothetical protein [Nocardia bovistercoris]
MIDLRGRVARCAMAVAAGGALVAGCGANDDAGGSSSAPPSTPREQLLLTEAEFPAGVKKIDVPQDRLQAATADLAGVQQNATFTPPECAATQQQLSDATKDLLAQSAIIGAADQQSGVMYTEFVAGRTGELARITEGNKTCPEVSLTTTVEGRAISTVSKVENLSAPAGLKGVDAIVYRSTSVSTVGSGKPLTTTAYMGIAVVRGATVAVRVSSLRDTVDEAAFTGVFTDAVDKVRKAA